MTSFFCSTAFSVSKQLSLWIWIDEFHLLWKYHQLCSNIFTRWVFPFWLPLSRRSGCKLLARSHAGFRPLCSSFDHFNILVNGIYFTSEESTWPFRKLQSFPGCPQSPLYIGHPFKVQGFMLLLTPGRVFSCWGFSHFLFSISTSYSWRSPSLTISFTS